MSTPDTTPTDPTAVFVPPAEIDPLAATAATWGAASHLPAGTTPVGYDLTRDQEWAQYGDELDLGTELLIEWGVKISATGMPAIYSLYGSGEDDERDAREFVRTYAGDRSVGVVARRVLYGPWGERNAS